MERIICNPLSISKKQANLNIRSSPESKKIARVRAREKVIGTGKQKEKMQPGLPSLQLVIEIESPAVRTLVLLLYSNRQRSMTLCTKIFPDIGAATPDIRQRTSGSHGTT